MAKRHSGHIRSTHVPVHHGRHVDKERHKGGPRYTGPTEQHKSLGGMPNDHMLDPPSHNLHLRGRVGHERGISKGHLRPDKRLGYTR